MSGPRKKCLRSKQEPYLIDNSEFAVRDRSTNPMHSIERYPSESRPTRSKIKTSHNLTDHRLEYHNKLRKSEVKLFPHDWDIDLFPSVFRDDVVAEAHSHLTLKTAVQKNDNGNIKFFNAMLYEYLKSCFCRLEQQLPQLDSAKQRNIFKNAVCSWFLRSDWVEDVLKRLKPHAEVTAHFAICLGICGPPTSCPKCQSVEVEFKFKNISATAKNQNRTQSVWKCASCGKETSIWLNNGISNHGLKARKKSNEPFISLFQTAYGVFTRALRWDTLSQTFNTRAMHAKQRKIVFDTINTFEALNPLRLGDAEENVQIYMDHKHLDGTKYGTGFKKNGLGFTLILGLTSDRGLVILQPVDGERMLETNHYAEKMVKAGTNCITDCGGAFNRLTSCNDEESGHSLGLRHQTCNHSGTKSTATGIRHRYVNPNENDDHGRPVCSNAIEGTFGKFQQHCISAFPERMKNGLGKEHLCRYYQFIMNRTSKIAGHILPVFGFVFAWVNPPNRPQKVLPPRVSFAKQYEVEKIMDSRVVDGQQQYLVKWSGCPIYQSSWVAKSNSFNASVNDYINLDAKQKERLQSSYNKSLQDKREKIGKLKLVKLTKHCLMDRLDSLFPSRKQRISDALRKAREHSNKIQELKLLGVNGHVSTAPRIQAVVTSASKKCVYHVTIGLVAETHMPAMPFCCQCPSTLFCYHMMCVLLHVACD